jgi:UBX domain-containing protein 1
VTLPAPLTTSNSRDREPAPAPGGPSVFRGAGNVLGSDDTPADEPAAATPAAPAAGGLLGSLLGRFGGPPPPEEEVQTRRLTFWSDGFSIEDGPLHAYDAPGNRELLEAIQAGRAPPSLFNVRYNQPIQIEVAQRTNEPYRPPPKVSRPFEGSGNRLGSPTPEVVSGTQTPNMPGGMRSGTPLGTRGDSGPSAAAGHGQNGFEVDPSKPTTNVQIRLGDGTRWVQSSITLTSRIVAKVNLTHRVGDLKNFVAA